MKALILAIEAIEKGGVGVPAHSGTWQTWEESPPRHQAVWLSEQYPWKTKFKNIVGMFLKLSCKIRIWLDHYIAYFCANLLLPEHWSSSLLLWSPECLEDSWRPWTYFIKTCSHLKSMESHCAPNGLGATVSWGLNFQALHFDHLINAVRLIFLHAKESFWYIWTNWKPGWMTGKGWAAHHSLKQGGRLHWTKIG